MFFGKPKQPQPPARTRRVVQPAQRSAVFSYHANRSQRPGATGRDIQEARPQPTVAIPWKERVIPMLGAGLALVVLGYSLRLDARPRIEPVGPQESQVFLRDKEVYEAAATRAFSSLGNNNKLTVNTDQVVHELTSAFPELSTVSVSLPFMGTRPTVYVQPAAPRLLLSTEGKGLYVLDSSGRALIAANQVAELNSLQLPVVVDQSGLAIEVGKVALPRATVAFVDEVVRQLQAKDIRITSLTLPAGAGELHVRIAGAGYYTKFNVHGNAREEAGAFLALKERLAEEKKTPSTYIDVRVEGRAYYK